MKLLNKAVLPCGFKANGISAGIKKSKNADLALIYSQTPCVTAGLFTSNKAMAAPVKVCKNHLKVNNNFRAIVANSGNANCFTGKKGFNVAVDMARFTAGELGIKNNEVLVASTGIIGKQLAIDKIKRALSCLAAGLSSKNIQKASRAIITTDKFVKEATAKVSFGHSSITICGIAKGAGMIYPHLKSATMLSFILTDANIGKDALKKAINLAANDSFNSITVDGCESTNDTVLILANGEAQNKQIVVGSQDFKVFLAALRAVCLHLAKLIVKDGEGATKIIQIDVKGAKSQLEAERAAFSIANSNLFKTAMYGADPNWGRIVAAIGASGVGVDEERLKIKFSPLNRKEVFVVVDLKQGRFSKTVYTCDLTHEYIKINAQYN